MLDIAVTVTTVMPVMTVMLVVTVVMVVTVITFRITLTQAVRSTMRDNAQCSRAEKWGKGGARGKWRRVSHLDGELVQWESGGIHETRKPRSLSSEVVLESAGLPPTPVATHAPKKSKIK